MNSVELVMMVEDYFSIAIANSDAETIFTINDFTNIVARYINVSDTSTTLKEHLFARICSSLLTINSNLPPVTSESIIANYLSPENVAEWEAFKTQLALNVPKPSIAKQFGSKLSDRLKQLLSWTPNYNWQTITMSAFTDAVCVCNYQTLIQPKHITTLYEIYVAIAGITVDKTGVDYYEITPEKSFTSDLGID